MRLNREKAIKNTEIDSVFFLLFGFLADQGAERDDDLSRQADNIKVPDVCSKAERGHVYCEKHRPHHHRDDKIIEAAVVPYRIEHQPDDRCGKRGIDQHEIMRGSACENVQYDEDDRGDDERGNYAYRGYHSVISCYLGFHNLVALLTVGILFLVFMAVLQKIVYRDSEYVCDRFEHRYVGQALATLPF